MNETTYLQIRGTLSENMVYRPRRGHESTRPEGRREGNPEFQLVLLDKAGRVLVSVAPHVVPAGCGSAEDPIRWRVRAALPLHPDGVSYELRRGEVRLYACAIPRTAPALTAPRVRKRGDTSALSWKAARVPRTSRAGVTYDVVAQIDGGPRITIARGLTTPGYTVDPSRISAAGRATISIVASDGVRSAELEATQIDVPARPPTVHIIAPAADERLPFGQPVSLAGACLDMSGRPCAPESVVWSLDGQPFASGSLIAVIEHPQPGTHRLTLSCGSGADRLEASTLLSIDEPHDDYRQWEALVADEHPTASRALQETLAADR